MASPPRGPDGLDVLDDVPECFHCGHVSLAPGTVDGELTSSSFMTHGGVYAIDCGPPIAWKRLYARGRALIPCSRSHPDGLRKTMAWNHISVIARRLSHGTTIDPDRLDTGLCGVSIQFVILDSTRLTDDFAANPSDPATWPVQCRALEPVVVSGTMSRSFTSDRSTLRPPLPSSPPTPLVPPRLSQE